MSAVIHNKIKFFALSLWCLLCAHPNFAANERTKWREGEDKQLIKLVGKYGDTNWRIIADKLVGYERRPKQCRERWINHLDPQINKNSITKEEWEKILILQCEFGNEWSKIAKKIPGRTPNQVKNRWHAEQRKEELSKKRRFEDSCFVSNKRRKISDDINRSYSASKINSLETLSLAIFHEENFRSELDWDDFIANFRADF